MAEPKTIRILAVDDHEMVRKGIRFTLLSVEDIEMIGEAMSGEEALEICDQEAPDVVIMDMMLVGEMDGVASIQAIRDRHPQIQVLGLSSFYDRPLVQGAMRAGAVGFLVKGSSGQELVEAIRAAYEGRPTLGKEAVEALIEKRGKSPSIGDDLTEQEHLVLAYLVEGYSNPQIAERQNYSVAAVKYHVSHILSKLGASNRTEAVALAIEHNLVPRGK